MNRAFLRRSAPTILSCLSAIGVVATAIMAVKATPKAVEILRGERYRRAQEEPEADAITHMETIELTWQCYIPTAIMGLATIGCIFGANALSVRNQASLASAYALLDQSYKRYRTAANSVFGEDADSRIKIEMAKKSYVSGDGYCVYDSDLDDTSDKILFYDSFGQRYFSATMASVLNAQYHVNRNLSLWGDVTLNDFFGFLGIEEIGDGDNIGWSMEAMAESGLMWLDFENHYTKMEDGMECYVISSMDDPGPL